jgi:predicted nucleic acid-binding protein
MGVVIDTSLPIAEERGRFDWRAFEESVGDQDLYMAAITVGELVTGISWPAPGQRRLRRLESLAQFEARMEMILPFDRPEAVIYGDIVGLLRRRGQLIEAHDLMIAATALAQGHAVATLNTKHFRRVPNL